jgi:hypothetical protein
MSVQLPTASFSQMAVMGEPTRTTVSELGEVGLGAAWTADRAALAAARAKAASIVFVCVKKVVRAGGSERASGRKGGKRTGRRLRKKRGRCWAGGESERRDRRAFLCLASARRAAVTDPPPVTAGTVALANLL